ncbi:MAG: chromate efflux transporter [Oceanospirillales bacterium]|nr:chromate efflux transporter [Oceanospirillales bacterium]MBR9887659.1 chromate efflux transporter [Oceanospirillales bacterium]
MDKRESPWQIFVIFLKLGLTSFGGPVAHLGYFREAFVVRHRWLSEQAYADLVALCQFLPGPASSQAGLSIGLSRSGYRGALAAWAGFTLPSAIVLVLVAYGYQSLGQILPYGVLAGLKIVALAVVAQAVWGMANSLCQGTLRISLMLLSACVVLVSGSILSQLGVMMIAALIGLFLIRPDSPGANDGLNIAISRKAGILWLMGFFLLLTGLPLMQQLFPGQLLAMIDAFYRAGALVFGGGNVVLPLLQAQTVASHWVSADAFLAGYGMAQAVPGPLFTFSAFLGASMQQEPAGITGAIICLLAIFLPSFLLVFAALPFWQGIRSSHKARSALAGVNAAVVGILLAALYDPVWTSSIHSPGEFAFALVACVALVYWKLKPWAVVIGSAVAGAFLL